MNRTVAQTYRANKRRKSAHSSFPGAPIKPVPSAKTEIWRIDSKHIDTAAECTYKTLAAEESARWSPLHCHDFYEMFLVTEGDLLHIINGQKERLSEGDCVFIRPDDAHRFEPVTGSAGRFTNIEISRTTIDALQAFLGTALKLGILIKASMPPMVHLDIIEKERLQDQLWELNHTPLFDAAEAKMRLRALLAHIFARYFHHSRLNTGSSIPQWLKELCFQMEYQPNAAAGVSRMVELSHKSPAYLSRSFRKYFSLTPSEYINHSRLNFAANLLGHTEYKISWIANKSGFPNLSNFYDQFFKAFGKTPAQFRKQAK